VVVTKLGGADVLGQVEVDASNWMSALRAGRERMGETATMPAGASCSIDGAGVATVLDPSARRRLVLTPIGPASATSAATPAQEPPAASVAPAAQAEGAPAKKRKRFETVAFVPGHLAQNEPAAPTPGTPSAAPQATSAPAWAAEAPVAQVAAAANAATPEELAASSMRASHSPPTRASSVPLTASGRPSRVGLEMIFQRDADPSADNPICYRERAFFVPRGVTLQEAEASLRFELAELQHALQSTRKRKLINLAAFDHRWQDAPERPPIVALQWRDWRGEVNVDYPAARISTPPPRAPSQPLDQSATASSSTAPAHDDRLDEVFQGLAGLSRLKTPVEGLDLVIALLSHYVPSEALSACLYDINTDELRFVSVAGFAANEAQGKAVPRAAGLFGQALRNEHRATSYGDVLLEPAFNPEIDSRPGLDARSMLLCAVSAEGHLLGGLQLINRAFTHRYDQGDANVVGYVAERLGEFLHASRRRSQSEPAPPRR
jgi:hypothetical protein